MKKIPTLFERVFDDHHKVGINNKIYPGMEWVLNGEGTATEKIDGSCCARSSAAISGFRGENDKYRLLSRLI